MGCVNSDFDACVSGFENGAFVPPNSEHVTYQIDYFSGDDFEMLHGRLGAKSQNGFLLEPQGLPAGIAPESSRSQKLPPKWCTVKKCIQHPTQLRLCVSGRMFMQFPDDPTLACNLPPSCAFAVCTRGALQEKSLIPSIKALSHSHTAQVVSSGLVFAVYVQMSQSGVFIYPRVLLSLESGDDIVLVDDRLGPIAAPYAFTVDFCIVDEGGRNVQFDVICRGDEDHKVDENGLELAGYASESSVSARIIEAKARTVRTCLQDYTTVNNHVEQAHISVGNTSLATHIESANVYLQNFVVSEEALDNPVPVPEPYAIGKEVARLRETGRAANILFEGADALKCSTTKENSPASHPLSFMTDSINDFWYHIRYDDDDPTPREANGKMITGEFWLSKLPVEKKNVYYHCSSTLAQALTMCIAFRFSCPTVHLSLISEGEKGARVLRHEHIPTNGIVMGIENDPRDKSLLRMFIEHRNEVLDDMTVCECREGHMTQTIVHQEVYDAGSEMYFRITLLHADGTRQSAVLQTSVDHLEDSFFDSSRGGQDAPMQEPSPRFPIAPCLLRHNLPPDNRIFVYTCVSRNAGKLGGGDGEDKYGTPMHGRSTSDLGQASDTGEDWQSVGNSDCEQEPAPTPVARNLKERMTSPRGCATPRGGNRLAQVGGEPQGVDWRRPAVQSATLLRRMEEPPFICFPKSLS